MSDNFKSQRPRHGGKTATTHFGKPPARGDGAASRPVSGGRAGQGGSMVLGIFIGFVLGIAIAFGIVWFLNKTPLPFQDKNTRTERKDETNGHARSGQAPQPLPGKPGDAVNEKPRFEFYKILPGEQGTVSKTPATATTPSAPAAAAAPAKPVPTEQFFLQAGAFQKSQDADNLKAKLSLLGLEVDVQEVQVAGKGTMHRVRAGPYAGTEEMNRVRNQMSQSGIQATPIKVKPE